MDLDPCFGLGLDDLPAVTPDPETAQPEDEFDGMAFLEDSVPPRAVTPEEAEDELIPTVENSPAQVSFPPHEPSPKVPVIVADPPLNLGNEGPSSSIIPADLETLLDVNQPILNPTPPIPSMPEGPKAFTASIFGDATSKAATPAAAKTNVVRPSAKPFNSNSTVAAGPLSTNARAGSSRASSTLTTEPERSTSVRANFFNPTPSHRPTFFNPTPSNVPLPAPLRSSIATAPVQMVASIVKEEDDVPNAPSMFGSSTRERAETSFGGSNDDSLNFSRPLQAIQTTQATDANDSDDDLVEIDPRDAPKAAKQRWEAHRTIVIDDDNEVSIKKEPEEYRPVQRPSQPIRTSGGGVQFPVRPDLAQAGRMDERSFLPGHPRRQREPINAYPASNSSPSELSVAARQRMMLQMAKNSKPGNGSSSSVAGSRCKPAELEESNSRKRRREGQLVPDDPAQVDAAMRDGEEDHSWMDQDEDLEDDYEALSLRINVLAQKYENEKITHKEKLELFKLRKDKSVKDRLRAAARDKDADAEDEDEETGLFVKETQQETIQRRHREHQKRVASLNAEPEEEAEALHSPSSLSPASARPTSEEDETAGFAAMLRQELDGNGIEGVPTEEQLNAKPRKPRKKAAPRARNAREFRELQREKDKSRRTAKATGKNAKGKKRAAGKGEGAKDKGKGKGKAARDSDSPPRRGFDEHHQLHHNRQNGQDDIGQMILDNLMNNDPISDRILNPIFELDHEPAIFGGNKETQLQKLFANIPAGTNVGQAKSDRKKLKEASLSFGYAKVRAKDGKWLVKGMKSTLYHHQLLGAQWMVSRELADSPPYGGLLADGMGLGKTVQTLACMVGNRPAEGDKARNIKATLIVVPSAVIDQWMDEIRNHAEFSAFPKIMHYKRSSKIPEAVLQDLDIVLTSYHEVMNQFPFPDQKARESIAEMGYKKWWKQACKNLGDLHKVSWYRVVLDEAHAIKNNSARTSLACQNLKSIYRWCLTGTPLLNRLEELFPYLRFLKANYSMDWKTFQRHFCDPDADDCHQRIATLLSYTMMRRTMKTTILNRPIIHLPKPHPEIQYVNFSTEERIIYRITENRFRSNLNAYFGNRAGTNRINYTMFLVQLLRLRQCTSHPFMLERTIRESWTSEDVNELRDRLGRIKRDTKLPFYESCKLWVSQGEEERKTAQEARDRGEEVPQILEAMPFGTGDYGHKFSIDKALKTLNEKTMYERVVCSLCSDLPMQPTATDCGHIFCKDCIMDHMHNHAAEYEDDIFACPTCDKMFQHINPYNGLHVDDEDGSSEGDGTPAASNKRQKTGKRGSKGKDRYEGFSKGEDLIGFEPATKESTWISRSDSDPDFSLTPSSKTAALKAILLKGFTDAPMDKVVIYVQFRLLARIVGRICKSEGWGFLYLTGDSSLEHRSKVIHMFRSHPDAKILIAGLKCGGLGLNFPWANRCISLDLWWNHAVDQQAFGRIFRIGQKKETHMTRIVVRNTVDMRLLSMQMYKLKTCERAMRDGDKQDNPALELKDLARLFGFLTTDEDGEIIGIDADYDDGDDDDVVMEEMD